jgi:hypothetical protein
VTDPGGPEDPLADAADPVEDRLPAGIPAEIAEIIIQVADRVGRFRARQIAGDPEGEIRKTRRVTAEDWKSPAVRRARVRYWVALPYVRLLVAHELYPDRFAHPGPFDTPARLAKVDRIYAEHFDRPRHGFSARMAGL